MIGQRLFTGRVAVAQAALEFRRGLFEMTKKYTDKKPCWAPTGEPVLSNIPQLKAIFAENERKLNFLDSFVGKCEAELSANLKANKLPSIQLVEAIAVAKVKAVEESIEISHRLQNEVGSYALMAGTGFEQKDFLTCCKFAEGDSRILMQKMSRDRLKVFEKKQASEDPKTWDAETKLCAELASKIAADAKKCGDKQQVRSFVSAVNLERGRPETHQTLERVSAPVCLRSHAPTPPHFRCSHVCRLGMTIGKESTPSLKSSCRTPSPSTWRRRCVTRMPRARLAGKQREARASAVGRLCRAQWRELEYLY